MMKDPTYPDPRLCLVVLIIKALNEKFLQQLGIMTQLVCNAMSKVDSTATLLELWRCLAVQEYTVS